MKPLRILIVEDEALIAMDLENTVAHLVPATFLIEESVAATKNILDQPMDFVFLDINVTDGKTFEIAKLLQRKGTPFAFVSGNPRHDLPADLRKALFISKPYRRDQIVSVLLPVLGNYLQRQAT
jgi:DNA-binding LytR/AlgR family response regulator